MTDDRKSQIVASVDHLVRPGEAWVIRRNKGELEVEEEGRSALASTHPELHGRLLQANEGIKSAGGWMLIFGTLAVAAGCLAIHLNWLDSILGAKAESLRSFWLYGFAIVASFFVLAWITDRMESMVYRRFRSSIINALPAARITPHQLISLIEGDAALSNVAQYLKKDSELIG